MHFDVTTMLSHFTAFGLASLSLGVRLIAALLVFSAVTAILRLLNNRGAISHSLTGFVKWLAATAILFAMQATFSPQQWDSVKTPIILTILMSAWLACRHGVEFFYNKFFLFRGKYQPGGRILKDLIKFCFLAILIAVGLKALLDIQLGSLLTSSAILTAVIGLSMQDTIGSLLSGLLLQIEKPFQEDDWIRLGKTEGQVKEVTWRYTKVVNLDGNAVLLPNNAVAKEQLLNYNRPTQSIRQVLRVPAPTDTPPVTVKSAILAAIRRADGVIQQPAPSVRLTAIRQDHIIYSAAYSISTLEKSADTADAVLSAIWYQFLDRNIKIPPPAQKLLQSCTIEEESYSKELATLRSVELLSGMSEEDLLMLLRASVARRYEAGQTILAKGESGSTMSIVLSGQVAVHSDDRELAKLGPGQIFGEMALLTGSPRQADIRALEPTRCLEVDREGFRMALSRHPEIVERVRRICEERSPVKTDAVAQDITAEDTHLFTLFKKLFL